MEALFLQTVFTSLTTSAVLLPVLLLSGRLQNRYAARTLWALFLVLALRLALPVDVSLPEPVLTVTAPGQTLSVTVVPPDPLPKQETETRSDPSPSAGKARTTVTVTQLGALVWAVGAAGLLAVRTAGYLLARRSLLRSAEGAGQAGKTPVFLHSGIKSPMVVGLFRPVIFLPQALTEGERAAALCHELCHIKRHDVAYKALLLWVTDLHWFNPLAWWLSRAAGRNLELCCDDDALRGRDGAFRRQYGELLLTMAAAEPGPALSTRFGGSAAELKKRLSNLFAHKKNSRALLALVLLCTLLAGLLVACQPRQGEDDPLDALQATIAYDGQTVSFTLPEEDVTWTILISGRMEADGMGGMSLHYLDGTDWTPGETYSFAMDRETAAALTELTMDVWVGEEERNIDLLPYLAGTEGELTVRDGLPYVFRQGSWTALSGQTVPVPAEWSRQDLGGRNEADILPDTGTFRGRMVSDTVGWLTVTYGMGVAHADSYVYRTQDGGETWVERTKPEAITFSLSCVGFVDEDRLILCGQRFDNAPCLITTDGGQNWVEIIMPDPLAQVEQITITGETVEMLAFISDSGGWRMTSHDKGDTWTTEDLGTSQTAAPEE